MAATQLEKGARFAALHRGPDAFVIANPWDAGSARLLAAVGFPALVTSSAAAAGTLGRRDGQMTRDEALAQASAIVQTTDLPASSRRPASAGSASPPPSTAPP
jgi:2-methylisocitrate lyase-like PEP mutase family enzyme